MVKHVNALTQLKDYVLCATKLGATRRDAFSIFWQETKNFRARFKVASYHPQKIFSIDTLFGKLYFRDNFGDITNLVSLLYRQEYRLKKLDSSGVILDAGANIGMAAVWFHHHNPDREIFCFEPLSANAAMIRLNCPQAKVFEVALGAGEQNIHLRVDPQQVMASAIPCAWQTVDQQFSVTSLDTIGQNEQWSEIALLKLDVEGMEGEILEGATETLQKTHHVIVETHNVQLHEQTVRILTTAGFRIDSHYQKDVTGLLFAYRP
jgi:FkbM family methyltransferase